MFKGFHPRRRTRLGTRRVRFGIRSAGPGTRRARFGIRGRRVRLPLPARVLRLRAPTTLRDGLPTPLHTPLRDGLRDGLRDRIGPPRLLACAALAAAALVCGAPAALAFGAPAPLAPPSAAALAAPAHGRLPMAAAALAAPAGGPPVDTPQPDGSDHGGGGGDLAGGGDPAGSGDLAGSASGAGRERPGRSAADPVNREAMVASRPLTVRPRTRPATPPKPPPTPTPHATTALGTEPNERAADLAAHLLPLGTGCALMGVGLGYLGVRLRRGI
ncbi:hypothetical protein [Streptomyces sp. H27-S2]|uniref:hypothetical protein n=1 Tax=Streptomyces antarcticus TaxID=2996458 RepID=UPI00226D63AC|nr:hypothetical protein [Streptomyces sp. H27-S2]MCY0953940.1 hypothetical protein [Streptomyces sp. H27-S2]